MSKSVRFTGMSTDKIKSNSNSIEGPEWDIKTIKVKTKFE